MLFIHTTATRCDARRKNRRRWPGAIGLIAARTWPSALRTVPRRKRSQGWMARITQTHLATNKPPFWCPPFGGPPFRQNLGLESNVSRGRNLRESIITVLRRSLAKEKTLRKNW